MKRLIGIGLALVLIAGTVGIAAAAGGPGYGGRGGFGAGIGGQLGAGISAGICRMASYLGLSDEQQQKLLQLRQDFINRTQALRFELQRKMLELRQLWAKQPLDQQAIANKTAEVTSLKVKLAEEAQSQAAAVRNVLTPEQQKKLDEAQANAQQYGPEFRGRGGRGVGRGMMGGGMRGTGMGLGPCGAYATGNAQ